MMDIAEALRNAAQTTKSHVTEVYDTLNNGSTGRNIRHDRDAILKTLVNSFPAMGKDPQQASIDDLLAFGAVGAGTLKGAKPTEFSLAHEVAQRNAALPETKGGLGLHPDNTAMERAKALGFDVEAPVYHASPKYFSEFDNKISDGIWATDNPKILNDVGAQGNNVNYPLFMKAEETLINGPNYDVSSIANEGYDSIKNIYEYGNDYAVINPNQVRSKFAAFDPMKKDSANILASLLAGLGIANNDSQSH